MLATNYKWYVRKLFITETIIIFVIDLPLCIHKIDLTYMITLTIHQTYTTAQSFRVPDLTICQTIPLTNMLLTFGLANVR